MKTIQTLLGRRLVPISQTPIDFVPLTVPVPVEQWDIIRSIWWTLAPTEAVATLSENCIVFWRRKREGIRSKWDEEIYRGEVITRNHGAI